MSSNEHAERPKRRHRHRRRLSSWLKRLPGKLATREINIYQILLAVLLGYLVVRVLGFMGVGQGIDAPPQ